MKNKDKQELKNYEKGEQIIKSHHLLSALYSCIDFVHIDKDNPSIIFSKNSYCQLNLDSHYSTIYINKESKLKEKEWAFVIATAFILLAFDLQKKITDAFSEKVMILFSAHYVESMLGFTEVPAGWNNYYKLKELFSFKNENSLMEQIRNEPGKHNLLFNFLSTEEPSITFNKQNRYYYRNSKKSINEIFITTLIEQAQKTIALRANKNFTEEEFKHRELPVNKAQRWFVTHYPLLSSLVASFKTIVDSDYCQKYNIEIAAVSAQDKLIVINPNANLSLEGLKFVIAHEILHIALGHVSRRAGRDALLWNLACDFVINHWLVEMNVGIPPEGVFLDKNLAYKSADEIYLLLSQDVRLRKKMTTLRSKRAGEKYNDKFSKNPHNDKNRSNCDMLDEDSTYFSDFEDACAKALLRGYFIHQEMCRGLLPASLEEEIKLVNQPAIPWQVELARWINIHFPLQESKRTYARPSRRQSATPDIPRPRYVRPHIDKNTRTFGVILDTSGSMDKQLLGKCLGAIASYANAQEVQAIRLIYCDAQPYDEGYVDIDQLVYKVKVKGRGGTVLQQAVNYLENQKDFPDKAPILILTDGFFEDNLHVIREHAFLVPNKHNMPPQKRGEVFVFK